MEIISSKIFRPQGKQKLTIENESEFVIITLEGHEIVMQANDAIKFSTAIMHHAKVAKRTAGDKSKSTYVYGDLRDAEANDDWFYTSPCLLFDDEDYEFDDGEYEDFDQPPLYSEDCYYHEEEF